MSELSTTAEAFVEMAHRIVWCTVATVDADGCPHTRVLHPIWEWDGVELVGWIATSPASPKARDLAHQPRVAMTYWHPDHDTCTAEGLTEWIADLDGKREAWDRFLHGPQPVGYDPAIIPGWTSPDAPAFGVLRIVADRLRVMPGALMLTGQGELLTWRR